MLLGRRGSEATLPLPRQLGRTIRLLLWEFKCRCQDGAWAEVWEAAGSFWTETFGCGSNSAPDVLLIKHIYSIEMLLRLSLLTYVDLTQRLLLPLALAPSSGSGSCCRPAGGGMRPESRGLSTKAHNDFHFHQASCVRNADIHGTV